MRQIKFHHNVWINLALNVYAVTMTTAVGIGVLAIVSNLIMGNVPQSFGIYGQSFANATRVNNDNINGQTKIQAGKWYFVAVTKSSTEGVKIYLNATLDGSCSSCTSNTELVTGKSLWFGMDQWYYENGWDDWFIGIIDEPRIYARVLSDYEIQLLYYNRIGAVSSKTI